MDDHLLLSAIRRLAVEERDSEAWDDLYQCLYPFLFATLFRVLRGNRFLAEESVQEVMIRLLRNFNFNSGAISAASMTAYLNLAARSVAFDLLRKEMRYERREGLGILEATAFSTEAAWQDGLGAIDRLLEDVVRGLPLREGQILQMLAGGLSIEEISENLNVTKKTAYNLTSSVRRRVRPIFFPIPGN